MDSSVVPQDSLAFQAAWGDGWEMIEGKPQPANLSHLKRRAISSLVRTRKVSPELWKLHILSFRFCRLCSQVGSSCSRVHSLSLRPGANKLLLALLAKGLYQQSEVTELHNREAQSICPSGKNLAFREGKWFL